MTIKVVDRLFETTATTGTGTVTLAGALQGFQSFSAAGNNAKVYYQINDGDSLGVVQNWEIGIGTVTVGPPNTLARTTIFASSNSGAAVNFGTGTKNVLGSIAAKGLPTRDENLNFIEGFGAGGGTANTQTLTLPVAPLGYSDGMDIKYFPTVSNTGAMTVNVNSLGAKSVKLNGVDPAAGVVALGTFVEMVYKATSGWFEIIVTTPGATAAQGAKADTALQQGGSFSPAILHVQDQKTAGTSGGSFASGSDQTRTLNTVIANTIAGASLASNQITLPTGTYDIEARAPGYSVNTHRALLYNVTDAAAVQQGSVSYAISSTSMQTDSVVRGRFTIAASKILELRHRCETTNGGGFGAALAALGVGVFADVKLTKVA